MTETSTSEARSGQSPSDGRREANGRPSDWAAVVGTGVFLAAVLTAAWLRMHDLSLKPLHSDEGVNGWFLMRLYNGLREWGKWSVSYKYDPTNYHGPFLYFAGLFPFFTLGPSNTTLRLLPALAGTGMVAILWPLRKWLGWAGLAVAAWLITLSPPFVYFSRTAIHEIYVVFFSLSAVVCFTKCWEGSPREDGPLFRSNWLLFGVISLALLFTNKETAVITYASFVGAFLIAWFGAKNDSPAAASEKKEKEKEGKGKNPSHVRSGLDLFLNAGGTLAILGLAVVVGVVFIAGKRGYRLSPADMKTQVQLTIATGIVCAAAWLWSTRGERFEVGARFRRLWKLASLAIWGFLFLFFGPVFVLRWLADSIGFLRGLREPLARRCERIERAFPAKFDDLSHYALAYAWGAAVVVILFTSFFNNMRGAVDMFGTYVTWVDRGYEGAGHTKSFNYWLELLWEYDSPILVLCLLGTVIALYRRDRFALFVAAWAWSQWLVYSVISYKTPWLNLNFTAPMCLVGALVLREIAESVRNWGPALGALAAPLLIAFWPVPAGPVLAPETGVTNATASATVPWWKLSWDVNFVHYDDDRYKIIYVQTVREFEGLIDKLDAILDKHGDKLTLWVTSGDYWPMPFYLREYKTVGYHQGKIPTGITPNVVVSSSTQEAELRERVAGYRRFPFMLRPGVALALFVDPAIWDPQFGAPDVPNPAPPPEDPALIKPGLIAEYRYRIGCSGEVLERRVDAMPSYGAGGGREFRAPLCVVWKGFVKIAEAGSTLSRPRAMTAPGST